MPHTLIRVFDEIGPASRAREALLSKGFSDDDVQLVAREDEAGPLVGDFTLPRIDTAKGAASGVDVAPEGPARQPETPAEASVNSQALTEGEFILTVNAGTDHACEQAAAIVAPYGARDPV